jgi:hypothetical protein
MCRAYGHTATTMKRICVIGDSHAAALKTGWDTITAGLPGIEPTFFAAMHQHMEAIGFAGDKLIATTNDLKVRWERTTAGLSAIDETYDAYLICGLGLKFQAAMQTLKLLRTRAQSGEIPKSERETIFVARLEEGLRNTLAIRIAGLLRQITDTAILFVPQPLPAEGGERSAKPSPEGVERKRLMLARFEEICDRLAGECKASFLAQRKDTRTEDMLATKAEYALGPSRLASAKIGADRSHMNSGYGAIVLRDALQILTDAPIRDITR